MKQYYCYNQDVPLGEERLGTLGKMIIRDLKTLNGVIRRCHRLGWKNFKVYTFTNFYDNRTFKEVYSYRYKYTPNDLLDLDLKYRTGFVSLNEFKEIFNEVYLNDPSMDNMLAHEIKIMFRINLLYRFYPLYQFGININLNDIRNEK